MSRLNKAILTMFFAGATVSQMHAAEKKKLEPIYKLNVLQYIPHVTSPDNAREVTANFEQLSTEAGETIEMSHINTFPIRNTADAKLFPSLQTQLIFSVNDYIAPDVENLRFDSRMDHEEIYFILQHFQNNVTQNLKINPCPIKNENDADRFLRIMNTQRVFSATDYIIPGITQIDIASNMGIREVLKLLEILPDGITFTSTSNFNVHEPVNMYDLFRVINGGSLYINGSRRTRITDCVLYRDQVRNNTSFRVRADRHNPNSVIYEPEVKFKRIEAYCKLHADDTMWILRNLLGYYNDAYWNAGDYDFYNMQNALIQATATSRCPVTTDDFFVTLALTDEVKDLTVITIPPVANRILRSTTGGNLTCKRVIFDYVNSKLEELGGFEHSDLTKVWIPDSVKKIDNFAFGSCDKLETVILPDELNEIDSNAFNYCTALKILIVPNDTDVYYHHIDGSSVIILVKSGEIHAIAGYYPTDVLRDRLKAYKKSDVTITQNVDGDFSVSLKNEYTNSILRTFEVIENDVISIPDGIRTLDNNHNGYLVKGIRYMDMKNGTSLRLPSTLRAIKSNAAFRENCIPANIKTVFVPLQICEIAEGTFYGDTLENVIIYGNGSESDKKAAEVIVRKAGFKGEIEFIDNI